MSKKDIIVGIDIGSSSIRTVIANRLTKDEKPRVIGVGVTPSFGVRRGVIVDLEEVSRALSESIEIAERIAGVQISHATLGVGGSHISSQYTKGVIAVGRADGEVTPDDIMRVIGAAQAISVPPNKEIIHIVPRGYSLDDQKNIKDPLGMNGVRLEVEAAIIEGPTQHMRNLAKCADQTGIGVDNFVLSPLAAAKSVLSKRQKELGVVLADIGGGSTSVTVFEENDLLHVTIIPVGGNHITNDIAIGLRTSIDVAEKVKLEFGNANPEEISKKENIDLSQLDSAEEGIVSRHHVAEIIQARLEEIFNLINKELRAIGRDRLLPAGIVITGGTSKLPGCVDLAKDMLGLPAQTGFPLPLGGLVDKVDDPSFATAVGLVLWALENEEMPLKRENSGLNARNMLPGNMDETVNNIRKWFGKFLP
ncbi:MAG: cell division protein FtsA [Candidatus Moranbacteria bacterium]|nr:cell division protein FtsA [Candidatus Moranbacteria bacterium]